MMLFAFLAIVFAIVVFLIIEALYKYKQGRASLYWVKCVMGMFFLVLLIIVPFLFENFFSWVLSFVPQNIGRSIVTILIGTVIFISSYPARTYMKYLNNENINDLPEQDRQLFPNKMFIDRFSCVWIIGILWMVTGVGILIYELWMF